MVRGRDRCWEHCVLVDRTRQKVRCNYCHREFSGGVYRMKFNLAQIRNKDVISCTEVPDDVRDYIRNILGTPKKRKTPKKPEVDKAIANGRENSSSASGGIHADNGSSGQHGSTCPSLLVRHTSLSDKSIADDAQKQKQIYADKKVAVFFFHNAIPFSAAKSVLYQEMMDAVAACGDGYRDPCSENLRSILLEKVKADIYDFYAKCREEWKETGCTILCNSYSDGQTKSFVAFSAICPKGSIYLKSFDISDHENDAAFLFELLESIVLEVGVENVIQVITNRDASCVYAGRLLMAKYNSLFWSPCVSYCVDKMLEDISKHEQVGAVLEDAKTIARYIHQHPWILNMMRKPGGGTELIRPRIKQYVTNYLTLRSIVIQEDKLKQMFSSSEWSSSTYSKHPDAHAFKSLLHSERFWESAKEAMSLSEQLIIILRIVDGDMPALGYIYKAIESAKVSIRTYYNGIEEKYLPLWEIIDRRWSLDLHSPLHAAAAFLNPSVFYSPSFKTDLRIRNGFQAAMLKLAASDKDKIEITREHPVYINVQVALGTDFAIMGRTLNAPGDWWASYGYEIPTLQRAAVRILSQPCSSHWCRWNWGNFERLHALARNSAGAEQFSNLVFVHCNLWLRSLCERWDGKYKAVNFDEIDVGSEWPTEMEPSVPLLDDSWLDGIVTLELRDVT